MVFINHHLVLTKREWTAVINAIDFMDATLNGEGVQDFVEDDLKRLFPSGFLTELSEKIATSN